MAAKTPEERETHFGPIVRDEKQFNDHQSDFKHWEKEMAFHELKDEDWHPLNSADDNLFQNFIDVADQNNIGKFREVSIAIEQNDLVLAETKNNAIAADNLMEENKKSINNIYLKTLAVEKQEIDASQGATLENIACQDPLEGGDAVYSARVMLKQTEPCAISARIGITESAEEKNNDDIVFDIPKEDIFGKLYPNPNDGRMQIDYVLKNDEKGTLKIYDLTGQLISVYSLLPEKNILQIEENTLSNGVYLYEICVKDKLIIKEKLIIIK